METEELVAQIKIRQEEFEKSSWLFDSLESFYRNKSDEERKILEPVYLHVKKYQEERDAGRRRIAGTLKDLVDLKVEQLYRTEDKNYSEIINLVDAYEDFRETSELFADVVLSERTLSRYREALEHSKS